MESLAYRVTLTTINCGKCGGVYAINERRRAECEQTGSSWSCPYCRCWWGYANNNENATLKRQLAQAQEQAKLERKRKEWAEQQTAVVKASLRAQKGVTKRLKNRIKHGVCPCCTRSFQNLASHMKTKHPEYVGKKATD